MARTIRFEGMSGGSRGAGGVTGGGGVRSVKVSSNVTVKAPKGKKISPAEAARLSKISKSGNATTTAKQSKKNAKVLAKSGKPSKNPKANTKYNDYTISNKGVITDNTATARKLAQKKSQERTIARKRAGFTK